MAPAYTSIVHRRNLRVAGRDHNEPRIFDYYHIQSLQLIITVQTQQARNEMTLIGNINDIYGSRFAKIIIARWFIVYYYKKYKLTKKIYV